MIYKILIISRLTPLYRFWYTILFAFDTAGQTYKWMAVCAYFNRTDTLAILVIGMCEHLISLDNQLKGKEIKETFRAKHGAKTRENGFTMIAYWTLKHWEHAFIYLSAWKTMWTMINGRGRNLDFTASCARMLWWVIIQCFQKEKSKCSERVVSNRYSNNLLKCESEHWSYTKRKT